MDSGPVSTFQVHEYLRPKVNYHMDQDVTCLFLSCLLADHIFFFDTQLCDLYENDSIFDKFECCLSGDGLRVATGSYRCVDCQLFGFPFISSLLFCLFFKNIIIIMISVIFSVSLVVLRALLKQLHWKLAKTP